MAEKATISDKICEELERWFDLVTKRQDEAIHKARNYVGSEEQIRSVSLRSREVASSKGSEKPQSSHQSRVAGQS